jgi:hypothetical protein
MGRRHQEEYRYEIYVFGSHDSAVDLLLSTDALPYMVSVMVLNRKCCKNASRFKSLAQPLIIEWE